MWPMIAAAAITMALIHLGVWMLNRGTISHLLFACMALSIAGFNICELGLMRAQTVADYVVWHFSAHLAAFFVLVSLVWFVRSHLGTGRLWLAWALTAVRGVVLMIEGVLPYGVNFSEITAMREVRLGIARIFLPVGSSGALSRFAEASLFVCMLYVLDAAVCAWRQGNRRRAAIVGGGIVFFVLLGALNAVLTHTGLVQIPYVTSFAFLGVLACLGYELTADVVNAASLTHRLQVREAELRESQQLAGLAAGAAKLGFLVWDRLRGGIWFSKNGRALFGWSEEESVDFSRFRDAIHPEDRPLVEQAIGETLERSGEYEQEYRIVKSDGSIRWIHSRGLAEKNGNGLPARMSGVVMDITGDKQAQIELGQQRDELAHLSRVTTVSALSGSLAHELNQPLGIILSNAQAAQELLIQDPPALNDVGEILSDIVAADRRAAEIIQRLRSLLKRGETSMQPLALNELLEEVLHLTRSDLIGRGVIAACDFARDLPPVAGTRVQIQQVALNLILNAADAMVDNAPGTRRLHIATSRLDDAVRVTVRDGGIGLPADTERLFQAFYTTKPNGLGMGLAICRSIIAAHNGRVWAEPHPERGAIFHFELPVAVAKVSP